VVITFLSQDIIKNGQIEPVILRKSQNPQYKYEIIAESHRWKACLEAGILLKGLSVTFLMSRRL